MSQSFTRHRTLSHGAGHVRNREFASQNRTLLGYAMTIFGNASDAREFEEIRPGRCARRGGWSVASTSARSIRTSRGWRCGRTGRRRSRFCSTRSSTRSRPHRVGCANPVYWSFPLPTFFCRLSTNGCKSAGAAEPSVPSSIATLLESPPFGRLGDALYSFLFAS